MNNVVTLSPIKIHLSLKLGVNENTEGYYDFLKRIADTQGVVSVPALTPQQTRYENLTADVYDIRLMTWQYQDENSAAALVFHVYPNGVAVVEALLPSVSYTNAKDLEQQTQQQTKALIRQAYRDFFQLQQKLTEHVGSTYFETLGKVLGEYPYQEEAGPDILWVARTLFFREETLKNADIKKLIKDWLEETEKPQDATKLINGEISFSMTWLNYVIVDKKNVIEDKNDAIVDSSEDINNDTASYSSRLLIDTMIMAQYYYTAQELCNQHLKAAISNAYLNARLHETEKNLGRVRAVARLHLVAFHEHLKHLNRGKRKLLESFLASWDFNDLIENSQRMVEVCNSKLEEANHQRRERSSLLTDLLLVSLSFFAVFELSLFLTQLSREMMSRPALDYQDESTSFFLSQIANIDVDVMITLGFAVTLGLVFVYRYIKTR